LFCILGDFSTSWSGIRRPATLHRKVKEYRSLSSRRDNSRLPPSQWTCMTTVLWYRQLPRDPEVPTLVPVGPFVHHVGLTMSPACKDFILAKCSRANSSGADSQVRAMRPFFEYQPARMVKNGGPSSKFQST